MGWVAGQHEHRKAESQVSHEYTRPGQRSAPKRPSDKVDGGSVGRRSHHLWRRSAKARAPV